MQKSTALFREGRQLVHIDIGFALTGRLGFSTYFYYWQTRIRAEQKMPLLLDRCMHVHACAPVKTQKL